MKGPAVQVSIHDVSPRWSTEVETALSWCRDIGAKPGLLVVPDMHHRHPLTADRGFCERLVELAGDGHEVFLHGYFHLSPEGRGVGHFVAQRVASAGEAEFAAYDRGEGERWLDAGLAMLRDIGLPWHGFIPPAWARRGWLLGALRDRGIDYVEDQLFAYRPVTGDRRWCPALNYASRTPGRRVTSALYARAGRAWRATGAPLRVAIHPADLHHPMLVRETLSLLQWAAGKTTDRVGALFAGASG